jgi:hypothetical protein
MAALRSGETLNFRQEPRPGEPLPPHMDRARDQPLSPEVARSVLQSLRSRRVVRRGDRYWNAAPDDPAGVPLTAVPEARALISLKLNQGELGQFSVTGNSGFVIYNEPGGQMTLSLQGHGPYAVGQSPTVLEPDNRSQNAELARDPALRPRISIRPEPSCQARPSEELAQPPTPQRKCTSADVLEALHRETGMPIVADFYTRLHYLDRVSVKDQTLFAALSHLADAMRLRWKKEGEWLHFRSASYYDDRLKEVPNRLLSRWAASRRQHGLPALEDLLEIARLSDAQLDAADMAEGARECWGLREWNLPRGRFQRSHLRFLAHLTPAQRQEAASVTGLPFTRMSLAQQQQYVTLVTEMRHRPPQSLEELAGASLHVAHTRPGGFQVQMPGPPGGPERGPAGLALVWEKTRTAALQAAQQLNPAVEASEIVPTELAVTVMYRLGSSETGTSTIHVRATPTGTIGW